jgi:DNA-binding transcriptional regulator YiaG
MITIIDLKAAREQLGLSQAAFARKIGVDQSTVWGWERDEALPKNKLTLEALERKVKELLEEAA